MVLLNIERAYKDLKPAIDHHMANNDHHSEFHGEDGINGMNLISLIEMLCDWKAAIERGKNGDILKSLNINAERKGISKQLKRILLNTIQYLNWDNGSIGRIDGEEKQESKV